MKLTPYKLARVLLILPEQDKENIKEEIAHAEAKSAENAQKKARGEQVTAEDLKEAQISGKTMSQLVRLHNLLTSEKNKSKGCFGKLGTNRKAVTKKKTDTVLDILRSNEDGDKN